MDVACLLDLILVAVLRKIDALIHPKPFQRDLAKLWRKRAATCNLSLSYDALSRFSLPWPTTVYLHGKSS